MLLLLLRPATNSKATALARPARIADARRLRAITARCRLPTLASLQRFVGVVIRAAAVAGAAACRAGLPVLDACSHDRARSLREVFANAAAQLAVR